MSVNVQQFTDFVIVPTLESMPRRSAFDLDAEISLALMCAAHESHMGSFLKQVKGPALGIYQMEPRTYKDIWINGVHDRPDIRGWLYSWACLGGPLEVDEAEEMAWNHRYATVMFRAHFIRFKEAIPKKLEEQALYLKKYWNVTGKATAQEYLQDYRRYVQ